MDNKSPEEESKPQDPEKRKNLKKAGALIGGIALGQIPVLNWLDKWTANPTPVLPEIPTPAAPNILKTTENLNNPKFFREINLPENLTNVNNILQLPLSSKERLEKEKAYLLDDMTLDQIDLGLMIIVNRDVRRTLLNKRFKLRQEIDIKKQDKRLTRLTENQIKWASDNKINPETLGICLDALDELKKIKSQIWKQIDEAFKNGYINPNKAKLPQNLIFLITKNHMELNPGAMAKLMTLETSGYENIGELPAISQINEQVFAQSPKALENIVEIMNKYGFKFLTKYIAGSTRFKGSISGGAISTQFMPENAKNIMDIVAKELKQIINPFDPVSATVMVYIFLSLNKGLENWNPNQEEINSVLSAGQNYSKNLELTQLHEKK